MSEQTAATAPIADGPYIALIILIMVVSGLLGGLANYFLARRQQRLAEVTGGGEAEAEEPLVPSPTDLWESLVMGVVAAFIVPLFLSTISSDLLRTGATDRLNLLVFGGFCLVAAIFARAFIRNISDAVLNKLREVGQEAEQAVRVAEQATQDAEQARSEAAAADSETQKTVTQLQTDVEAAAMSLGGLAAPTTMAPAPLQGAASAALAETAAALSAPAEPPTLDELAAEYNEILQEPDGPTQTARLTGVLSRMRAVARFLTDGFDVSTHLKEDRDAGKRLAAYAYLCEQPQPAALQELVSTVTDPRRESQAFGQYWGIQAIERVTAHMRRHGSPVPHSVVRALTGFRDRVGRGTDRQYEVARLLSRLEQG
ncbi:MAG: hypothetical protein JXA09_12785 [Anaerolineae bacterium]|nr:hypothetical protein [Anaerolineae bacterium]